MVLFVFYCQRDAVITDIRPVYKSSSSIERIISAYFQIRSLQSGCCCCCLLCNHCSNRTWVVEEILAFGNRLRSTHCREFHYLKLCRPAFFVRTNQLYYSTQTINKFNYLPLRWLQNFNNAAHCCTLYQSVYVWSSERNWEIVLQYLKHDFLFVWSRLNIFLCFLKICFYV